ncbi:transient receptor potential cation channel subfamily M member 1-like [Anneissia japonica]|uniref:transient receptor potential cation channel subfamily M member 1-like n=1 Tax=Anneissia japonica TaxID=1529436 RepID=UPI0014255DF5|nr:transient receptor potential cation channel subfamily M member 1-like [Anneissia japonica]
MNKHTNNRVHPSRDGVLTKRNVKSLRTRPSGRFSQGHSSQINNAEDSDADSVHSVVNIPRLGQNYKSWITATFMKKECVRYVPKPNDPDDKCYCGRSGNQHIREALRPQVCTTSTQTPSEMISPAHSQGDNVSVQSEFNVKPWDKLKDVKEFPNDSFGKIQFLTGSEASSKVAHYVRLSNDTRPKDVLNLLSKHWKLPTPHLAISVAGGTKNFTLNKQDQDTFNRGLIKYTANVHFRKKKLSSGVRKIKPSLQSTVYGKIHGVCRISENDIMIPRLIEAINVIMQHESMITIFSMDAGEQADLDLAVLKALLKGQSASPASQLKLALSWGRVDVAESMIFVGINEWPPGSLDVFVTQALMENRVDFLQLFLENGAIMKEYLTVARLRDLYNKAEMNNFVRKLLASTTRGLLTGPFYLHHVRSLIRSLTGAHDAPLYHHDRNISTIGPECKALVAMSTCLSGFMLPHQAHVAYMNIASHDDQIYIGESFSIAELVNPGMHFQRPFRELFLWAVLVSRMELAEFFWERGEDPVCLAIVASRLFRSMSKRAQDPDDQLRLLNNSRQFETLAICVIDECFDTNEELAQIMIEIPHNQWGGMNTLKIAAESEAEEFISRPCAQAVLNNIWMDGIRCSSWKAFLVLVCPPLLLVIPYRKDFASANIWKKAWMFYNAPVSKFFGGLITYMLLLLLFSYVLIFNFESKPSPWENILFGWICTLIIEEIRQFVIPNEFETWDEKIRQWTRSVWNWIDAAMLSLACMGYGLHWSPTAMEGAKGCFSASCFLFYVRLLRMYAVSTHLGPKMVMIRKMIVELLLFLCILLVFMIGYGVASQSLLFPNQRNIAEAITGVFYMPYFQILGELFLDVSIEGKLEDCSNDPDDNLHPCPEKHLLVSVLLVIYLLVGNVLLLNLLIAIFSFVFDEIQSKALQIWKYESYALVMEYADRPSLVAPFIIIEHIYMTIKWLYRKAVKSCDKQHFQKGPLYNAKKKVELRVFEKECAASYRRKKANFESSQVIEKVGRIEKRLEESLKQTEHNKDDLNQQFMNLNKNIKNLPNMPPRMETPSSIANSQLREAGLQHHHDPPEKDVPSKGVDKKTNNELPVKDSEQFTDRRNDARYQELLIEDETHSDSKQLDEKGVVRSDHTIPSQVGLLYPQEKSSRPLIDEFDRNGRHAKKKRRKIKHVKKPKHDSENPTKLCSIPERLQDEESLLEGSDLEQASLGPEENMIQASLANIQVIARQQATAFVDLKRGIDLQMQLVQARLGKLEKESQGNKDMLNRIEHLLQIINQTST